MGRSNTLDLYDPDVSNDCDPRARTYYTYTYAEIACWTAFFWLRAANNKKKKKKNGVWFPDLETEIHSFLNLSTSILYSTYEKKEKEKKKKKKICTRDVYSVRNLYERGVMSENITSDRRQNGRNIWNAAG